MQDSDHPSDSARSPTDNPRLESDEAEVHDLVNRLKEQSKTINSLTAELAAQKSEANQNHQKHIKWQEQLRDKLATYREERKVMQAELVDLRSKLSEYDSIIKRQHDELSKVKNERSKMANVVLEMEPKIRHIEDYETRNTQLTNLLRLWEDDVKRCSEAQQRAELWRGRHFQALQSLSALKEEIYRLEEASNLHVAPNLPVELSRKTTHTPKSTFDETARLNLRYLEEVDKAKQRAESAERENLDLRITIERLSGGLAE